MRRSRQRNDTWPPQGQINISDWWTQLEKNKISACTEILNIHEAFTEIIPSYYTIKSMLFIIKCSSVCSTAVYKILSWSTGYSSFITHIWDWLQQECTAHCHTFPPQRSVLVQTADTTSYLHHNPQFLYFAMYDILLNLQRLWYIDDTHSCPFLHTPSIKLNLQVDN